MQTQPQPIDSFELDMMCYGPFYEARTRTLRIPHRWGYRRAAMEWRKRGFEFDAKRSEYYRSIPERHVFEQTAKCREFFYALYQAEYPQVKPTKE